MRAGLLLVVLLLTASDAFGQAANLSGFNVGDLPRAAVLDNRGVETRGRLVKLDDEGVVLLVDGAQRRFPLADVNRVTRRGDSLKNGAITGAVVGLVGGAFTAAFADCVGGCRDSTRWSAVILGTGVYAAIGTSIDALIQGRTTLYQAPTVRIAATSTGGATLAVRLTW